MDRLSESDVTAAEPVDDVFLKLLASGESMNIQHFRIEPGATVPEHSHHHEQLGYITQGTLVFLVDGEELPVGPGDSYSIPGGELHAAENRGEETVLGIDVFSPPRDNPDWAE